MRIKKITLHGFKSFADKTTLAFSGGTSAIIGPNGCGKSNVVDAIRWVIGEQNARHLRGKSMEDIIFNGTDSRKPVGMAEVVLTFSNNEGKAPARFAGFPEIEISRRLYRSGESEYGINKVQCRLKDVVELFTDTGIGTRAYSIIEQGQIGWLVNAKPIERRVLFEEAAGINKYKQKKETALRRLKATDENLTRVSDIIGEVKRQLNSLNRQAKKAERYKVFKDELKGVDIKLGAIEFTRMVAEIEKTGKSLVELSDSESALVAALGAKEALAQEARESYTLEEEAFRAVKERVHSLEKRIQDEEFKNSLATMRIEELERNGTRLGEEIEELMRLKAATLKEIEQNEGFLEESAARIEQESRVAGQKGAELEALSLKLKEKEREEAQCKAESLSVMTRLQDLRHALQSCLKEEEQCRVVEAQTRAELAVKKKEAAELQAPVAGLRLKAQEAGGKRAALEADLAASRLKLDRADLAAKGVEEELGSVKNEYVRAGARLATLEEMEKNFENVDKGTKSIMQKAGTDGILALLADVIEPNKGYERAVEAAMGARLQCVVVESNAMGLSAVEYLKSSASGRSAFLSLKEARAVPTPASCVSGATGVADEYLPEGSRGLLSEVKVKQGYGRVVESLLGSTLVVDDLKAALGIWADDALYRTVVTRAGEVVTPEGIIVGGDGADGEESFEAAGGLLQRKSEIRAIEERERALALDIERLEGALANATQEVLALRAGLETCKERLHASEIEGVNSTAELKAAEEQSARLAEAIEALGAVIESKTERIAVIGKNKAALSAERDTLEKSNFDNDGKIEAIVAEAAGIAVEKERLSSIVTELKVSLAKTTERHEQFRRQLLEKRANVTGIERRVALKAEEIEAGRVEAAQQRETVEAVKASVEGLLKSIGSVRGEEVSRKELIDALGDKIKRTDVELRGLTTELNDLKNRSGELTLAINSAELKVTHLKEGLIERYGVNIETVVPGEPVAGAGAQEGGATTGSEGRDEPGIAELEERRTELRAKILSMGEVSLSALEEYNELSERYAFLTEQQEDLQKSVDSLKSAVARINRTTRERFKKAFDEISEKFKENFPRLFNGGKAELRLTDDADVLEAGIEIVVQPPGKKLQNIVLLSGGEKALTAVALIFSIFLIKPSPFCLLDEVDAPLDDANIDRFNTFVRDMSKLCQFLLITHSKRTMEMADSLYGVTMEEPGVSKMVSVTF